MSAAAYSKCRSQHVPSLQDRTPATCPAAAAAGTAHDGPSHKETTVSGQRILDL
jgi:hypothetical protein